MTWQFNEVNLLSSSPAEHPWVILSQVVFRYDWNDTENVALTRTDITLDHSEKGEKLSSFKLQLLSKLQPASFQEVFGNYFF